MAFAQSYRGVVALMAAAHTNSQSALYASCAAVHSASARFLRRAQALGKGACRYQWGDLFALVAALGWAVDQPSFAPRAEHVSRNHRKRHLLTSSNESAIRLSSRMAIKLA